MTADETRRALARDARRYAKAQAQRDEAIETLRETIRRAVAGGMSKSEVCRETGLARQTVYDALRE